MQKFMQGILLELDQLFDGYTIFISSSSIEDIIGTFYPINQQELYTSFPGTTSQRFVSDVGSEILLENQACYLLQEWEF